MVKLHFKVLDQFFSVFLGLNDFSVQTGIVFNPFLVGIQHLLFICVDNIFLSQLFIGNVKLSQLLLFYQQFAFLLFFPFDPFALFFRFFLVEIINGLLPGGFNCCNLVFNFFPAQFQSQQAGLFFQIRHLVK